MRFQPSNPDTGHPALHTLYLACTGGGKSQACNYNKAIPKKGARVVLWDPSGDYPGLHCTSKQGFIKALKAGLRKGHFRVAYSGPATPENFEWWCEVVWSILDGRHITYAIAEELSAVCVSVSKAGPNAAILLNQGRKYGLRFHGVSQKPQEISKTFFDMCPIKWIGQQKGAAMRRRMAAEIGVTEQQIGELQPLEFLVDDGTANEPEKVKIPYRKVTGIHWQKDA